MLKNIKVSFLQKAEQKSKALVLGVMLLLFAVHTAKAQNNLNMRFYGIRSAAQSVGVDVTSLDAIFGSVTVNGVVMTTDAFGTVNGIEDLPTSVSSYNGIQMIYVNGFNFPGYIGSISQQQADALISFVKQGGVLVGSMEGMTVLGANQDFNKYVGERLLLQPGVNITPTAANGTIPNTAFFYHNNNGPLNLNAAAVSVPTTTSGSTFSGVPSESIIFTTAKPTTTAQCTVNRVLDFVAPSYPGDVAALTAGIKGFAYLSGEVHGSLTCGLRNDTQANVNLSNLIYDFLYNPSAMVTRRAWSQTLANVNSFCPVTSFPVENIPVTNICPATTVNLSSHHTATPPVGTSVVWFDNNTHTGTPIADPTAVGTSGTYYAFYYDSVYNCYSPPSFPIKVTIISCPCVISSSNPDSDGDGIADSCDLDDDNDGILDSDEMKCLTVNAIQPTPAGAVNTFASTGTPSFTATFGISTVQSAAYIYTTSLFGYTNVTGVAAQTNTGSPVNSINFNRPVYSLDAALDDVDGSETATLRFYDENNILIPGSVVQTYVTFIGTDISSVTYPAGQSIHVIGKAAPSTTVQSAVRITFPSTLGVSRIEFSQITTGGGGSNNGLLLMNGCIDIDTDGDGIWNRLDLDSDNDGCLDAIEGTGGFTTANLVNAGGTVTVGTGSSAPNQNLGNTVGNTVTTMGIPTIAGTGQGVGSAYNAAVSACIPPYCYKPGITTGGSVLDTKVGITSLDRAGATDTDNWPMTRKGGWIALEAKTKGFVPNRVEFNASGSPIGIPAANFVEGMMVFDTINKCMKMYTSTDGGTTYAWLCISTQTCPD